MRKLTFEEIKSITHGVARVELNDDRFFLHRFTKEQQELYKTVSKDFYIKSFSTAGVTLEFETDSENLLLSVIVVPGSSRRFFTHSIFSDDERIGELSGNIGENESVPYEGCFSLPGGMKKIRIVFPWSVASSVKYIEIDDNAKVIPIIKSKRILMFGDSITQGYDALIPENSYASLIAREFNAEAINKGIGGEKFFARLGKTKDDIEPDLITVAYGTNDWSHRKKEDFEASCKGFFKNLRSIYPDVRIVALTPVWRADKDQKKEMDAPFTFISDYLNVVSKEIPKMSVIEGINLIPQDASFYQMDGLHPIDKGFLCFFKNLKKEISKYL